MPLAARVVATLLALGALACGAGSGPPPTDEQRYAASSPVYRKALQACRAADAAIRSTVVLRPEEYGRHGPVSIARVEPRYPAPTRRPVTNVLLEFDVLGSGRVGHIRTRQQPEGTVFAKEAARAAELWLFEPAVEDGVGYVRADVRVELQFDLADARGRCAPWQPRFPDPEDRTEGVLICSRR